MENVWIRDMAMVERPRERLAKIGASGLKEDELLALVLRTGYKGHGVMEVARQILAEYPVAQLMGMPLASLARLRGMGISRASILLAAVELVRRSQSQSSDSTFVVRSMDDIVAQAVELRDKKKEHLMAFFLNARHELIGKEIISMGTLTASLAHPREIFAPAIGKAAAAVILVHNHPSGDPSPSEDDIRLTQRIRHAGQIMGIDLLDHFIVAERGSYSFKKSGRV